ncbi:hypothetical protein CTAYLR_000403 [Chrysophaeum taylorii]|uniref:HSF-type DNA-binding domain-containing protein n=1 Tax=Chrysophaeum taylorii TaxID=2483200 RepID=A0AAD7XQH5_9STRA|nr:hypothetical protein CTAYLR_000403 [Chrysophaeum taylorii]
MSKLDEAALFLQEAAASSKRRRSLAIQGEVPSFVRTVYTLLKVCDASVIRWSDDGTQVIIVDPDRFGSEICPKFFRHRNVHSFTRLLNMYQFRKVSSSSRNAKDLVFEHHNFRRDREDLLIRVQRKSSKIDKWPSNIDDGGGLVVAHLEQSLCPSHSSSSSPPASRLDDLEAEVKALRAQNTKLKDLEEERNNLVTQLQQQRDALATLMDLNRGLANLPVVDQPPLEPTLDDALMPMMLSMMMAMAATEMPSLDDPEQHQQPALLANLVSVLTATASLPQEEAACPDLPQAKKPRLA